MPRHEAAGAERRAAVGRNAPFNRSRPRRWAVDRKELRFRILFEYYSDFHSGGRGAGDKVGAIDADSNEKRAAEIWLIDEVYVEGRTQTCVSGRIQPFINRINSRGINFVESVMDDAFTEIRGKDESFDSLSKTDKIKRFAAECLGSPATGLLCRATYEAIADFMAK